jgi:hypothetical protein
MTGQVANEQLLLNPASRTLYVGINACQSAEQLDVAARLIWERYGVGAINDDEASYLASCIERRRPPRVRTSPFKFAAASKMNGRISRFTPRQRQRSPDRKASRDRRRKLGGSSALPDDLRQYYTEGQRAVLFIVATAIKNHGVCDLPVDKIAALAGVCRTTVQTTMHEARRLNHIRITERPVPGRKSLPNLVEITSREWMRWLKRAPATAERIGSNSMKMVSTTKSPDRSKKWLGNDMPRGTSSSSLPRSRLGLSCEDQTGGSGQHSYSFPAESAGSEELSVGLIAELPRKPIGSALARDKD